MALLHAAVLTKPLSKVVYPLLANSEPSAIPSAPSVAWAMSSSNSPPGYWRVAVSSVAATVTPLRSRLMLALGCVIAEGSRYRGGPPARGQCPGATVAPSSVRCPVDGVGPPPGASYRARLTADSSSRRCAARITTGLGLQAFDVTADHTNSVVQPIFPSLPELDLRGRDAVPAPVRRNRDLLGVGEAGRHLGELIDQRRAGRDRPGLM